MAPRVLIGPAPLRDIEPVYGPILRSAGLDLVFPHRPAQMSEEELLELLPGCVASLAGSEPYTPRVLDAAARTGLRVIARAGVGYDGVDVAAATAHRIPVAIATGTNHEAVAEQTFALLLALAKGLFRQDSLIRQGDWPRKSGLPLRGRTLGIVGLGRIGKAVARRGLIFGMNVVATDPVWDAEFTAANNIARLTLEELLREADFISLHVPLTPDTRHLVNRQTLALMKPTAFLINTARGGVVNEADLCEALTRKRIAGAGLDVFAVEPPGDCPLLALENVVLTAHTAGVDAQALQDMARKAAESIAAILRGDWPAECIVNPEVRQPIA